MLALSNIKSQPLLALASSPLLKLSLELWLNKFWVNIQLLKCKSKVLNSIGMAELANESVVHPRDPGSNLGTDRKYFLNLFVSHLNSNM